MPYHTLTQESRYAPGSRVMLWGRPNTFKTTAIVQTWPRPAHFISLPGEKGYETIPDVDGITSHVWQVEDLALVSPVAVLREMEEITAQVLGRKHGPVTTLAVEGLHKVYDYAYDAALNDLLAGDKKDQGAEAFRGPAYGIAHKTVMRYLNKVAAANVEYLVMTCWEGDKKDDPKSRQKDAPTHKAPQLPGQLADAITGEFGVSIRSTIRRKGPQEIVGQWQLLPDGQVQGCAVKVPLAIAKGLPRTMPQDFRLLQLLLQGVPQAEAAQRYATIMG